MKDGIFFSEVMPFYDKDVKFVRWYKQDNWAIRINGRNYYGAKREEDIYENLPR